MNYENDKIARYLAMRVLDNRTNGNTGIVYETAITSIKTTKEAIDWWIDKFNSQEV